MKKLGKVVISALLAMSMLGGCSEKKAQNSVSFTEGTYSGISENGKNGSVEVEVEFSKDSIISVVVTKEEETPSIAEGAIHSIPAEIVEKQSLNIDSISGATITSQAILEAVSDAVKQANGDVELLKAKENVASVNSEVKELSADVVVVGAGAAGMSAAVSAAYEGMESVIVFEKMASVGGNAIVSGGWIEHIQADDSLLADRNEGYDAVIEELLANGPQTDEEKAIWDQLVEEVDAWKASNPTKVFDSTTFHAIDFGRIENASVSGYITYAERLIEFDSWLEEFGAKFNKNVGIVGYSYPRWSSLEGYYSGQGFFDCFEKAIEENNYPIDIYTSTPVTKLITNDAGDVVGVEAKSNDGTTYKVNTKNVILCTGGYSANLEMVIENNSIWGDSITTETMTTNRAGVTGDGIVMAEEVGGFSELMDNTMLFPFANIHTGSTESIVGNSASALLVNKEGNRFVDESSDRYTISGAQLEQTDKLSYIISSENNSGIKDGKTQGGENVDKLIEDGELFKADTLEELASITGITLENLKATISSYNEMCTSFVDEDFGRTSFAENSQIGDGPYYAYPCTPATHITIGGIVVDDNQQVIKEDGTPINGLYAAGEVVVGECGIGDGFAVGKAVAKEIAHLEK